MQSNDIEYSFIEEQLTDEEIELFNNAIEAYTVCNYFDADYCIAHMRRSMWKPVHEYLNSLDSKEVDQDAKQDH
jgi:hypothetical protein